jgi:asparagine synthase (glutamine-hydrolysing)
MVLSGESADEVFGGYLYFHKAPNNKEFYEETVRKLFLLSKYDCLPANKLLKLGVLKHGYRFLTKSFWISQWVF